MAIHQRRVVDYVDVGRIARCARNGVVDVGDQSALASRGLGIVDPEFAPVGKRDVVDQDRRSATRSKSLDEIREFLLNGNVDRRARIFGSFEIPLIRQRRPCFALDGKDDHIGCG